MSKPLSRIRKISAGYLGALFLFVIFAASCRTTPVPKETPLPWEIPPITDFPQPPGGRGGIVDEIRFYTEMGTPSSLLNALEIIRSRNLGNTEFGRLMVFVNVRLMQTLYSGVHAQLPPTDPPLTHIYSQILRDAERGIYRVPNRNSRDYLELVLPFLGLYIMQWNLPDHSRTTPANVLRTRVVPVEQFLSALPDLQAAARLNSESFLAPYFIGIVYERSGRTEEAFAQFSTLNEQFPEAFPAALALARIMISQGRGDEAVRFLSELLLRFPDNNQVKRQMALAFYQTGDWSRAETAAAEILQRNPRDGEFILMRAHILVEQGRFLHAQAPLDIFATINPSNRRYLFLRARVQAEGHNNRDAALNYLRAILRHPAAAAGGGVIDEAAVYAARLLMMSPRPEDQAEGRALLVSMLSVPEPSLDVLALALEDAIRREDWAEARTYLPRLLSERRSSQDLLAAFTVERGQGNHAAALAFARELHERDPTNEEGMFAFILALIETGRQAEAAGMIERRLAGMPGGPLRSRYLYLRSRTRATEEQRINDLRASLFEDPRNLHTHIAMFEIYHRRRDQRRAFYYLRQALALAPNNPRLLRYEAEYAGLFMPF